MKKKTLLILLCMLLCLAFTGCDKEPYEELKGTVHQKEIKPEKTETKKEDSTNYEYHYPERYVIYVNYDLGNDEFLLQAFYVSKSIYDETNIGDEYYYNSEKDKINEPYDKKEEK